MNAKLTFDRLSCGIPICVEHAPDTPLLSFTLWIHGGSEQDPPGKEGLAHLCEHLLLRPLEDSTSKAHKLLLDGGVLLNGHTNNEWVSISAQAPLDKKESLIDLVADLILAPYVGADDLEREKVVLINEYSSNTPSTIEKLVRSFHHSAFKNYNENNPIGDKTYFLEDLVNADVQNYYRKFVNSDRMLITIHGTSEGHSLIEILDEALQELPSEATSVFPATHENGPKGESAQAYAPIHIITDHPETITSSTVVLLVGYKGPCRFSNDYLTALAFEVLMADGLGSCLYQWLRNEDFGVYNIASMTEAYSNWGSQYYLLQVKSSQINRVAEYLGQKWESLPSLFHEEYCDVAINKFVSRSLSSLTNPHERMALMRDMLLTASKFDKKYDEGLEMIVLKQARAMGQQHLVGFYNEYANWDLVSLISEAS